MPLRNRAPSFVALQERLFARDPQRIFELMSSADIDDSRYMHWDQLSRRTPPAGLSAEEWWFAIKMQRTTQRRSLPLFDKAGAPFGVTLNDEVLRLSEEIARRAGGMIGGAKNVLSPASADLYLVRSLVEESIRSSQLEGASTTRRVAAEMIDSGRKPKDHSEMMILGNYLAMGRAKTEASGELTPELVLELHRTLTEGTLEDSEQEGKLQGPEDTRIVVMAGDVCVHVPPAAEELPGRLEVLCRFANGTVADAPYLPPVVRAIITHFMFGYDHYFEDGNGRTARAAFYWSMLHNGYWLAEFAAISTILRKAPGQYGDAYEHSEDDDGDLTYFVLHQLRVFERALDELDAFIERQRTENLRVREALSGASDVLSFRQARLLESLSQGEAGSVAARAFARDYRVTEQTARNDLKHLERLGLLARLPRTRPAIWVPAADFGVQLTKLGFDADRGAQTK